jgi:hypothetical protein
MNIGFQMTSVRDSCAIVAPSLLSSFAKWTPSEGMHLELVLDEHRTQSHETARIMTQVVPPRKQDVAYR